MGKRSKKWTRTIKIKFKPNEEGYDLWDADNGKPLTENDLTDEEKELILGALKDLNKIIND